MLEKSDDHDHGHIYMTSSGIIVIDSGVTFTGEGYSTNSFTPIYALFGGLNEEPSQVGCTEERKSKKKG